MGNAFHFRLTTYAHAMRHPSLDDRLDPAVRIAEPGEADWPAEFERETAAIRAALGPLAACVDHVGSTAVPGLAGKPIVDIQVTVATLEPLEAWAAPLQALGYLLAPDPDSPDFHFLGKPAGRPRRFHVHVCLAGSGHRHRHLAVRDYLRAHPAEARAYEALKRELVARAPGDRLAYIAGKDPFMAELEERALRWATTARGSMPPAPPR